MYLDKYNLQGKRALISGGTQGIGLAIAQALAECGASLTLLSNDERQIPTAKSHLNELGYQADCYTVDVTQTHAINSLAKVVEEEQGGVDILVCSAGVADPGVAAEELSDESYLRVLDINLNGVFRCCRAFGSLMLKKGQGSIVNIGSMSGLVNNIPQKQLHYNVSKAGVHQLTKALAAEWADRGVRVNCVAPTYIETPLTHFGMRENPEMAKTWLEMTPMHRIGQPHEVASVVLFLASEASSLLTGSLIVADAGYTLW